MPKLKMFTEGIHYKMEEYLYDEATVIKSKQYKFYKHKLIIATKDSKNVYFRFAMDTVFYSAFCPLNKASSFSSQGPETCSVYLECSSSSSFTSTQISPEKGLPYPLPSRQALVHPVLPVPTSQFIFFTLNLRITDLLIYWYILLLHPLLR